MLLLKWALALVLVAVGPVSGQSSGSVPRVLRGTELVVATDKIGPSTEQPGLHVLDPDTGWRRLVSYGRRPRWSPRHEELLYWCDGLLWRLKVGETKARVVPLGCEPLDDSVEWSPDGATLLVRSCDGRLDPTIVRSRGESDSFALRLWPSVEPEHVGRWSASADGQRIAYEVLRAVPRFGPTGSVVRIRELGGGTAADVRIEALGDALLFNPQWQPNGRWLACEAAERSSNRRLAILLDPATKELRRVGRLGVQPCGGWPEQEASALLRWSPDGKSMLALLDSGIGQARIPLLPSRGGVVVVDAAGGGPNQPFGAPLGHVVASAWRADSQQAAVAVSHRVVPYAVGSMSMVIWRRTQGGQTGGASNVDLPPGLQVVDMDW